MSRNDARVLLLPRGGGESPRGVLDLALGDGFAADHRERGERSATRSASRSATRSATSRGNRTSFLVLVVEDARRDIVATERLPEEALGVEGKVLVRLEQRRVGRA